MNFSSIFFLIPILLFFSVIKGSSPVNSGILNPNPTNFFLKSDYDLLEKIDEGQLRITSLMSTKDYDALKRILGSENGKTLDTFLLFDAMRRKKYSDARKYLNQPLNMTIINGLKDWTPESQTSILIFIEALRKNPATKTNMEFSHLVTEIISKVFRVNIFNLNVDSQNLKKTIEDDKDKIAAYMTIRNGHIPNDKELIAAVKTLSETSMTDIVKIMVENYLTSKTMNDLDKLYLFYNARTLKTQKLLLKMGVSVLADENIRVRSAGIYDINDQESRTRFLNLAKLTKTPHDVEVYNKIFKNNIKMTISEAIATKNDFLLEFKFLLKKVGIYKSDWIMEAVKNSNLECLKVLLNERVPLPKTADLEAACLARHNKKDCEALKTINEFRKFYRDDGICIEGPLGCDPVVYERNKALKTMKKEKKIKKKELKKEKTKKKMERKWLESMHENETNKTVPVVVEPSNNFHLYTAPINVIIYGVCWKTYTADILKNYNESIPEGPNLISECYPLIKLRKQNSESDVGTIKHLTQIIGDQFGPNAVSEK